jgi:glutamate/tyrosine decarboxylase-like PLP-dependent enzyme
MANFTGLAAGRQRVLTDAGWEPDRLGLSGAPRLRVLAGGERHDTLDLALRYLGLGGPRWTTVTARRSSACRRRTCTPANFDPVAKAAELAHRHGSWVHVDGAFGLWAAASPALRPLVAGLDQADSWATDAHKTLNVPYDCGISIVARPAALHAAMGVHAHYLQAIAEGIAGFAGGEALNDVVFTQVCASFGSDARTREVTARLLADGVTWMSGSRWQGRDVLRVSVSNWSTDDADVAASVAAVRRAAAGAR